MKNKGYLLASLALAFGLFFSTGFWLVDSGKADQQTSGTTIFVDTTEDGLVIDGNCTLREAVIASNTNGAVDNCPAGQGIDTIFLPIGTYFISLGQQEDDNAQVGDLDILESTIISGAGKDNTIIDGNQQFAVFHILSSGEPVTITNLTIQHGFSEGYAGGVMNQGQLLIFNARVIENQGHHGGGINNAGNLKIDRTEIISNTPSMSFGGGGIYNTGVLSVTNSLVAWNSSYGGILNWRTAFISNTTIMSNTGASGGGIGNQLMANLIVRNSTISGNQSGRGGGIQNFGTSLVINNCTITGNIALRSLGGGLYTTFGTTILSNSIIAGNSAYFDFSSDCHSDFVLVSEGFNLIGISCGIPPGPGDITGLDPLLGPLEYHSGSGPMHALLWPSPAIDAGNPALPGSGPFTCEKTDQRGVLRPKFDGCDIGAYEVDVPPIILPIPIEIDIKPGSEPNSINCNNEHGVIPVAILTGTSFDATTVDHGTVTFEGAKETHLDKKTGEPRRHEEDVDGDGDIDLVFHFRFGDTDLTCESTEGLLGGETFDGLAITGSDSIRMVGGEE